MIQLLSYFNILAPPAVPDDKVTAAFKASQIMPGPRDEDFDLLYVARPSDIKLAVNMTSTPWLDLADQVGKGHITVTRLGVEAAYEFLGKYQLKHARLIKANSKYKQ
jgi:hypothetical protein